jgi:hypothetical protein
MDEGKAEVHRANDGRNRPCRDFVDCPTMIRAHAPEKPLRT